MKMKKVYIWQKVSKVAAIGVNVIFLGYIFLLFRTLISSFPTL